MVLFGKQKGLVCDFVVPVGVVVVVACAYIFIYLLPFPPIIMASSGGEVKYHQNLLVGVNVVLLVLATASFVLRLYARRLSVARYWYDDVVMGFAMVSFHDAVTAVSTNTYTGV